MSAPKRTWVVRFDAFRQHHRSALGPLDQSTRAIGKHLARAGLRRVLVVATCPRHDQSTQWWYEQALLAVLAAAGVDVTFVTDGFFTYDTARLAALGPQPTIIETLEPRVPPGAFDAVVALPPSDLATRAAADLRVPLVACMIKFHEAAQPALTVEPHERTRLWHAFAGMPTFEWDIMALFGATSDAWVLMGAPFPVNRYYFPRTKDAPKRHVLLFGTNARDLDLAVTASKAAGESRIAVLGGRDDRERTLRAAAAAGVEIDWAAELAHEEMLALVASSAVVINPVETKSHYSLALALALGRPTLVTDSPSARAFFDPALTGLRLLPAGDIGAWTAAIAALRDPVVWQRASDEAAARAVSHHDAERFFASAISATLTAPSAVRR